MPEPYRLNAPILSVIVPMTRMAGRMANLDRWLFNSGDLPITIVIVHDIQDALTAVELRNLVAKYSHLEIEMIEGTYGAPGLARNAGLKRPLATWTAFWDSDDLPIPRNALKAIADTDSKTEVIIGNFIVTSDKGTETFEHGTSLETVALNPGLWRMLIRSSILEGVSFSSTQMGEDQLFLVDLNLGSRKIYFSKSLIYEYFRGKPWQLTSNQDSINDVENTFKLVYERLRSKKNLLNVFSRIVLMRLFTTTIVRTKGAGRIGLIIRYAGTIVLLNPRVFAGYLLRLRRIQAKKDE